MSIGMCFEDTRDPAYFEEQIEKLKEAVKATLVRNEYAAKCYQEQATFCTDPNYKLELTGRMTGLLEANTNLRRAWNEVMGGV